MKGRLVNFELDFAHMEGVLTRAGEFVYSDGSHFKDWDNLKEVFATKDYLPIYGSRATDSHTKGKDRFLGFGYNWSFNEKDKLVNWNGLLFEEIEGLTDLDNPTKQEFDVSLGFIDATPDESIQTITKLDHIGMSLNNLERGRCRTANGTACYGKIKTDFQEIEIPKKLENYFIDFLNTRTNRLESPRDHKNKKVDTKTKKNEKKEKDQKEITEDSEAEGYPDNIGSHSDKKDVVQKSGESSFMLDCQKYGTYSKAVCGTAWQALNNVPSAPDKGENSQNPRTNKNTGGGNDFEDAVNSLEATMDKRMSTMEAVLLKFGEILPNLSELSKSQDMQKAQEIVNMKTDLVDWDYCDDFIETLETYDDVKRFHIGAKGNKATKRKIAKDMEDIGEYNTSQLLGKKKQDKTDFEDNMTQAMDFARNRFYPEKVPIK